MIEIKIVIIDKIKARVEEIKQSGLDENEFNRIKKMLYGEYVCIFNDVTRIGSAVVSDYFKGINSFDYVEAYKTVDKEYVERVMRKHFNFEKMAVSIIKP